MQIIPAIYLSSGNAVSHYKGEAGQTTVLSVDPLASARRFEKEGARVIHLVDLEDSEDKKNRAVAKLIAKNTSLRVEYADGISSIGDISALFEDGMARVSLSQFSEKLVPEALKLFGPDKIIFTIRAQRQEVTGRPGVEVFHYIKDIADMGIKNVIFRDIKAEGTLHPNFDEIERLVLGCASLPESERPRLFAFGGIGTIGDLEILARTGAFGAIISRAFFENKLSLGECIDRFQK